MRKDDRVYLHHILDAIEQIEDYLEGVQVTNFLKNRLLQDGVVRQLEIIGEASRNLSDNTRSNIPDINWRQIIGLRNRLIHAYYQVNYHIVWEITQYDLPLLRDAITTILKQK